MKKIYITAGDAATITGRTLGRIYQRCEAGEFDGAYKENSQWRIPCALNEQFNMIKKISDRESLQELETVPVRKREEALRRLGLIRKYEDFARTYLQNGGNRTGSTAVFARKHNISSASLYRWKKTYQKYGLIGLVDGRGGKRFEADTIAPEAWEFFKGFYLDPRQPSIMLCREMVQELNRYEKHDWRIPSLRTMHRLVDDRLPMAVQVLHREGLNAYNAKCGPYIQTDCESIGPGEVWVSDHSQFNVWVWHNGRWLRPWITAWMDLRSRMLVGWYISENPNQTTILFAMKRAVKEYGLPFMARMDNGKDYDSEMFQGVTKTKRRMLRKGYLDESMLGGIYALLGIKVSFALPYHPQSKPIERLFDTIDMQFTKTLDLYCGKDTARKPEQLVKRLKDPATIESAYSLQEFADLFSRYAEIYNHSAHSGKGMDGRSPAEVFETRERKRAAIDDSIDLLMCAWSGDLKITKNGLQVHGIYYGQYQPIIYQSQGKTVRVSYDPDDMRQVRVYEADTLQYLCTAEQNQFVAYGEAVKSEDLRQAMRQKNKMRKLAREYRDNSLVANMDLANLALRAKAHRRQSRPRPGKPKVTAVKTIMDGQAKLIRQSEKAIRRRKAVGADDEDMEFDLDLIAGSEKEESLGIRETLARQHQQHESLDFDFSLFWDDKNDIKEWLNE